MWVLEDQSKNRLHQPFFIGINQLDNSFSKWRAPNDNLKAPTKIITLLKKNSSSMKNIFKQSVKILKEARVS